MGEVKRQTFAILVDNEAGVLSQVSHLFSRKGYNIDSISAGITDRPEITRITIEVLTDDDHALFISNQLRKLIHVHSVKWIAQDKALRRELAFFKVKAENSEIRNGIIQVANIFRANILDVAVGSMTLSMIGDEDKIQAFQNILAEYEVLEIVRAGIVAIERGPETIYDDTKEKGEFNYGKNVL